jgi:hypothetical protein
MSPYTVKSPSSHIDCLPQLIHTGHGFEFSLPGIAAEGLSQAAVHFDNTAVLFPPSLFGGTSSTKSMASKLGAFLPSLHLTSDESSSNTKGPRFHALEILAELQKKYIPIALSEDNDHVHTPLLKLPDSVKRVNELVERWSSGLMLQKSAALEDAFEELA